MFLFNFKFHSLMFIALAFFLFSFNLVIAGNCISGVYPCNSNVQFNNKEPVILVTNSSCTCTGNGTFDPTNIAYINKSNNFTLGQTIQTQVINQSGIFFSSEGVPENRFIKVQDQQVNNVDGTYLRLYGSKGKGSGYGGDIELIAGSGGETGDGGNFQFAAGSGGSTLGYGGSALFSSGSALKEGASGSISFLVGTPASSIGDPYDAGDIVFIGSQGINGGKATEFKFRGGQYDVIATLDMDNMSEFQTFTFPNKSGIFALTSDISGGSMNYNNLLLDNKTNNLNGNNFTNVTMIDFSDGTFNITNSSFALNLTGSGWANVSYSSAYNFSNKSFSIVLWIYPTALTNPARILDFSSVNPGYSGIMIYQTGATLSLFLSSTGTSWDLANGISLGTISTNKWYQIAIVRNGTNISTYLNNTIQSSVSSSGAIYNNQVGTALGNYPLGSQYYVGRIDEFQAYNRTLTTTEMSSLFNSGNGYYGAVNSTGLIGGYHFDNDYSDFSGFGNTALAKGSGNSFVSPGVTPPNIPTNYSAYIKKDLSNGNLYLYTNGNNGVVYTSGATSSTAFLTRTSTYNKSKGKALDYVHDADYYLTNGKVDDTKFYGSTKIMFEGKEVDVVDLEKEVNVLRQSVFELKKELCLSKPNTYSFCEEFV